MQLTEKLLIQVSILIFTVRDAALWEWSLPFCCGAQALLVCIICILHRHYQNYPTYFSAEKQYCIVKQQNSCKGDF